MKKRNEQLAELCKKLGSQRAAARFLRVNERTVRRWVAGDRAIPWHAMELLRIKVGNM
jgi:DNA-binding transcriptional regulator YdaS (Cro superfamily)